MSVCVCVRVLLQEQETIGGGEDLLRMTSSKVLVKRSQLSHLFLSMELQLLLHLPPPSSSSGIAALGLGGWGGGEWGVGGDEKWQIDL